MARSFTEKQIRATIRKAFGTASKRYEIDETYTDFLVGGSGKSGPVPIEDRHDAGVLEKVLENAGISARMLKASREGWWIEIPKIEAG